MKSLELREKSITDLQQMLIDEQENLANLRFQLATSQLESPIRVRTVRRDIAKIMTILRQKERTAAPAAAPVTTETASPATTEEKKA
jgi:large subunit ribosomal protein L29